jgi:hypothetical protein
LDRRSCAKHIPLSTGTPARASTLFGSDELSPSCVRGIAPACLFELDVAQRSELRVALETSDFDGALALFSDSDPPRELRCIDDAPSGDVHHARFDLAVAPGRYLIAVDGASGEAGDFELFAELEPLPAIADACAGARPLSPMAPVRDSTRGGANLFTATCGGGAQGPEHLYTVALERPGRVRIRQHAEYDGSLYMRAHCEDVSSELACNDDFQGSARSSISASLDAGSYYVYSDSFSKEQSGDYVLALERVDEPPSRPPQAWCAEAVRRPTLTHGLTEVDTLYGSSAFRGSCGGEGAPEIVLPLRVEAPITLVAVLEELELNAVMYVRRVCDDASSELACYVAPRIDRTSEQAESSPPALVTALERGSYVLVIDGYEPSDIGAATLRVLLAPPTAR